jgi:hemerythrin
MKLTNKHLSKFPEELKTNIEEIDRQHMTLLFMVDDLIEKLDTEYEDQTIVDMLNFLKSYVDIHFKTEEKYMKKSNYKNYENHKIIHDNFRNEVYALYAKLSNSVEKIDLNKETINSVKDWIINHVKNTDIKMAKFLKEKLNL